MRRADEMPMQLPADICQAILSHVSHVDLARMEQVSKSFATLLSKSSVGESLWAELLRSARQTKQQVNCSPRATKSGLPLCATTSKARYIVALRDSRRTSITRAEVSSSRWHFRFVGADLAALHMTAEERAARHAGLPAVRLDFSRDGLYTSSLPGAPSSSRPLAWSFVREGCTPDESAGSGSAEAAEEDAGSAVRIAQYPLLTISRTDDWGWRSERRTAPRTRVPGGPQARLLWLLPAVGIFVSLARCDVLTPHVRAFAPTQ